MAPFQISIPIESSTNFDVVVTGGGLAGCCAAIASARHGARTLLAEAMPYIGGNGVIGLPISSFRAANSSKVVVGGIAMEILDRLRYRGALKASHSLEDWLPIDCEILQIEMTKLLDEAGVELLTHSPLLAVECQGRELSAASFYSKEGALRYEAKLFIDATGDAQLAKLAGLQTPMGRQRDGRTQSMSMMFTLGGVDESRISEWTNAQKQWDALRENGIEWRNPRTGPALSGPFQIPGKAGVCSMNVTRILVEKGTDSRQLTAAEKEGRYQVEEFVERFLKPHVPGYENCYLTQLGCRVGVRETRRIIGLYELQRADLTGQTKFPDAIACNSYPVDIHSPDNGNTELDLGFLPDGAYYTIPYRCLVARDADNLLACGRCISATHEALSAVRVLAVAMPTGEAAGTAAALCVDRGTKPSELSYDDLRYTLRKNGAIID